MTDYCVVQIAREVLVGGGAASARRPAVFVAYRFDFPQSVKFRVDLEAAMRRTAALTAVEIQDGRTFIGQYWPSEVRDRLTRAEVTIADLTVLNREVLFECGFAWGLGRPILPVAATPDERARVPGWFTDIQFGHFSSDEGMAHLVDSIAHHLVARRERGNTRPRRPKSNPRGVVIIEHNVDHSPICNMIVATCNEYGMDSPTVIEDPRNLESIESLPAQAASRASLFIGVLNGTPSDFFVHFAAGAVLAAPTSGESRLHLTKRVLLVVPDDAAKDSLTPTSARKCVREVSVITRDKLSKALHEYGQRYKKWQKKLQG